MITLEEKGRERGITTALKEGAGEKQLSCPPEAYSVMGQMGPTEKNLICGRPRHGHASSLA